MKRHGAFAQGVRPKVLKAAVALSNQCFGLRLRPYRVRLRRRYVFGGVMGHPGGGRQTYFLSSGNNDWQKAWIKSPDLGRHLCCTAMARRRRISICDMTGAKQSDLDQSC